MASERCPRCGAAFDCGAHEAAPCACTTVALDGAMLAALRATFSGCLCLACLQAIAGGDALRPAAPIRKIPNAGPEEP
ncbi:MAG: cysteine-rich CWC family protein [Burkholderiaceae bacterium]